jgi:predicted metal-binding membrane protein
MLVLVAMGVMNLLWMVLVAGVVILEKTWRHGPRVALAVGAALIALGLLVPAHPGLAPGLYQPMPMPM